MPVSLMRLGFIHSRGPGIPEFCSWCLEGWTVSARLPQWPELVSSTRMGREPPPPQRHREREAAVIHKPHPEHCSREREGGGGWNFVSSLRSQCASEVLPGQLERERPGQPSCRRLYFPSPPAQGSAENVGLQTSSKSAASLYVAIDMLLIINVLSLGSRGQMNARL